MLEQFFLTIAGNQLKCFVGIKDGFIQIHFHHAQLHAFKHLPVFGFTFPECFKGFLLIVNIPYVNDVFDLFSGAGCMFGDDIFYPHQMSGMVFEPHGLLFKLGIQQTVLFKERFDPLLTFIAKQV